MTNPQDPRNPYGGGDYNSGGTGDNGGVGENGGYDGYGEYGPTNHPEDAPGFGQQSAGGIPNYPGYPGQDGGAIPGGQPGPGYQGYSANEALFGYGGAATVKAGPETSVTDAIGWGFKATFGNAKLWIVGGLVYFLAAAAFGALGAALGGDEGSNTFVDVVSGILSLVVMPFILRLALWQIDDPTTQWGFVGRDVKFWPTLGAGLVASIIPGIVAFALIAAPLFGIIDIIDKPGVTDDELFAALGSLLLMLLVVLVVTVIMTPLFLLMQWHAADGASVKDAIVQGFRAGLRHFFPLLGFTLLMGLIMMFGLIVTLGLGACVLLPAYTLGTAHYYRQVVGGEIPAAGRKA